MTDAETQWLDASAQELSEALAQLKEMNEATLANGGFMPPEFDPEAFCAWLGIDYPSASTTPAAEEFL